jgi:hypothetical protein
LRQLSKGGSRSNYVIAQLSLHLRNRHVDPEVSVVGEQLSDGCVEHQTVAVHDGTADSLVDAARHRFPRQPSSISVELESVGEILGLLSRPYELNDGEELLMAIELLLLLQHEHKVVAEAGLHHHPIDGSREVDVSGEKHNVLALQRRNAFVVHDEVWHDVVERSLPFAARARTGTQVRSKFAGLLVIGLLRVDERCDTAVVGVLAGKLHVRCDLLHG